MLLFSIKEILPPPDNLAPDTLLGPVLAAFLLLLILFFLYRFRQREDPFPYEACKGLLTDTELRFHETLERAVADAYRIYAKVRLEDVIRVRPGTYYKAAFAARNRIKSRHLDFVLCDPESLEIIASVELDDRSHERRDRIERDAFVDEALRVSGIPCIRIPVSAAYCHREVRDAIDSMTG